MKPFYIPIYNDIYMGYLSANPNAILILEQYPDYINPFYLSMNTSAIHLIIKYIHKIDFIELSKNTGVIRLLNQHRQYIQWNVIGMNKNAISIIENDIQHIYLPILGRNPNALHLIMKYIDHINWFNLLKNPLFTHHFDNNCYELRYHSRIIKSMYYNDKNNEKNIINMMNTICDNPLAIHIIEKYQPYINWYLLSSNPKAIHLLEKNIHLIHWWNLCQNKNAIPILEKNIHLLKKEDLQILCFNPNALHLLFKYDYPKMKEYNQPFYLELIQVIFCPSRISRLANQYQISFRDYLELISSL